MATFTPGPLRTDASSSGPHPLTGAPRKPAAVTVPKAALPTGETYYTTLAEAHNALPSDTAAAVRFRAGKGYYVGAPLPAHKQGSPGAAPTAAGPLQQAQQTVQSFVDPIIQEIQRVEEARSTAGQNAITGYTQAEQKLLQNQSPLAAAAYGTALQGQNAIDQALASRLQGEGDANASALSAKLAQIAVDQGTAARLNGEAAANATGAANAAYANGSATLSALNQEGAANQGYLNALPGIAGLSGLQASKGLQGQINTDLQSQLGNITSQVPGMVQTQLGNIQQSQAASDALAEKAREFDTSNLTSQQKTQVAALIAAGRVKEAEQVAANANATKVSIANANNATKTTIATANNQTKQQIAAANAAAKTAASKAKSASVAQVQNFLKGLTTYQTVTTKNGDSSTSSRQPSGHSMNYTTAYKWLRQHGQNDVQARTDLAGIYKRGEDGRAWLTNEEQAVLKEAQAKTSGPRINMRKVRTVTVNGVPAGYLTPGQASWLKAAHMLPAGEWNTLPNSTTQVYYIKPTN